MLHSPHPRPRAALSVGAAGLAHMHSHHGPHPPPCPEQRCGRTTREATLAAARPLAAASLCLCPRADSSLRGESWGRAANLQNQARARHARAARQRRSGDGVLAAPTPLLTPLFPFLFLSWRCTLKELNLVLRGGSNRGKRFTRRRGRSYGEIPVDLPTASVGVASPGRLKKGATPTLRLERSGGSRVVARAAPAFLERLAPRVCTGGSGGDGTLAAVEDASEFGSRARGRRGKAQRVHATDLPAWPHREKRGPFGPHFYTHTPCAFTPPAHIEPQYLSYGNLPVGENGFLLPFPILSSESAGSALRDPVAPTLSWGQKKLLTPSQFVRNCSY